MSWVEVIPGLWKAPYVTKLGIECNAMALRIGPDEIAVVSPPTNHDAKLFDETAALGRVTALVAPNVGHDSGQRAWQQRFPDARAYAPYVAAPKITKAQKDLRPFEPMSALAARLPANVRIVDLPGTSSGSTVLRVDGGGKRAIVIDDCMMNVQRTTGPAPFRFLFWLTGSAPGLVRNKIWWMAFAKDKPAVAKALLAEWDALDPSVVAFLHGDDVDGARIAEARAQIAAMAG